MYQQLPLIGERKSEAEFNTTGVSIGCHGRREARIAQDIISGVAYTVL